MNHLTKKKRLEGRCAVITGAAGGIAIATALSFVTEGAKVSLVDLDRSGVESAVDLVAARGGEAKAFTTDITSRPAVDAMFAEAAAFMGGIDILVTCAGGYTAYAVFEDIDESDWDQVIDVNLKGVYLCCKAVIPFMKERG